MEDVDRVSDLPDSILCHILSFLSTKDAVVTSILSTRWRYLFTLLSNLDFDLGEFTSSDRRPKSSSSKIFLSFVGKMLFFHKTNVDKFRLKCGIRVDCCHVYGWILAAVWRRSQDPLSHFIKFLNDDSVKNLFTSCTNLEDVIIEKCNMENINNFNISHHLLQSLTILHSSDSSNCWLIIDSPNLAYFKYIDHVVGRYSLENLQSIVSVDIHFIIEDDLQADATALFTEISNVRSLLLSSTSLKKVLISLPEKVPSCLSFKLKVTEFSNFRDDKDCIEEVKYILKHGGALQKLTIRTASYYHDEEKMKIADELFASPRESKQCCILIVW
ncbi:hypothetical protein ES332_D01G086000v1 [Gossypium tomentosum]|uniref:F-box domain-containing protein n=1 Tax=Gossypium tomentosum TaxID=34277 RepID=A0A5D2M6R9_GOSTO|nr:hypothetical protein ES332_D01G086000v1 [Gossypium tomentosum]